MLADNYKGVIVMYVVIETKTGKKKGQFESFLNARKRKNNLEASPSNKGKKYEIKEVK